MSATQIILPRDHGLETHQRMQPETGYNGQTKLTFVQKDSRGLTRTPYFRRGYIATIQDNTQTGTVNVFSAIPRRHRKQKPVSRGSYESSRLCRVYELDMTDPYIRNIPRAGVLFYTFINGELYICFGRDQGSNDLTDFGGGRRQNETPVRCAVREGNEESRFAFSEISPEQVQGFYCLYSSNMLIIFIPVVAPNGMDIREVTRENFSSKQFLNCKQSRARCFNEVSDLVWLGEKSIENLFSSRPKYQMFAKVRRFIYSCEEFSRSLVQMKRILRSVFDETEDISGKAEMDEDSHIEELIRQMYQDILGTYIRQSTPSPGVIQVDNYALE